MQREKKKTLTVSLRALLCLLTLNHKANSRVRSPTVICRADVGECEETGEDITVFKSAAGSEYEPERYTSDRNNVENIDSQRSASTA